MRSVYIKQSVAEFVIFTWLNSSQYNCRWLTAVSLHPWLGLFSRAGAIRIEKDSVNDFRHGIAAPQ